MKINNINNFWKDFIKFLKKIFQKNLFPVSIAYLIIGKNSLKIKFKIKTYKACKLKLRKRN